MSIKEYAREILIPSGNHTGVSLFYSAANRLPAQLQFLPNRNDDSSSRIMKGIVLFVSGIALHFFAFFGALWNAWGVGASGFLFLICDLCNKKGVFGIEKTELSNNVKTCLIQGLFGFGLYSIPWWALGLANAAHAGYSYLVGNNYGIEHLQTKVTQLIRENVQTPVPQKRSLYSTLSFGLFS